MKKHRWNITLALTVLLLGGGLLFLWQTGFFAAATSLEGIRAYIEEFSPYSQAVFFSVQLASVILAPIPSNITAAAGALLFGMWPAFCSLGRLWPWGRSLYFVWQGLWDKNLWSDL